MYPEQLAGANCELGEEVERIRPARDFVGPLQVQRADLLHDSGNVVAGSGQVFDANLRCHRISIFLARLGRPGCVSAYHALKHDVGLSVTSVVDNAGAIDQKDAAHEGDVLPHLHIPVNHIPVQGQHQGGLS